MNYLDNKEIRQSYDFLKANGAKEVFLFGSRYDGTFSANSDLDLGVKGFPPENYFSAIVDLEYSTKLRIDLVDFDSQSDFYEHLVKHNAVVKLGA